MEEHDTTSGIVGSRRAGGRRQRAARRATPSKSIDIPNILVEPKAQGARKIWFEVRMVQGWHTYRIGWRALTLGQVRRYDQKKGPDIPPYTCLRSVAPTSRILNGDIVAVEARRSRRAVGGEKGKWKKPKPEAHVYSVSIRHLPNDLATRQ
ncbi:hypothetical protein ARMSODRAFT_982884 [Armillaria solidipes]|uniref:Uncharacterized protein n=1 Tax=Armillaria solidipes TaxID=1076256 RepID=A0A2H3APW2_9AGAR|nr:hypothetical protein ARMSODRAFT_982884 [Armillaria solidipes]